MARYTAQRVIAALIVLVLMSFVAFMLINATPGNTLLAQIASSGFGGVGGFIDTEVLAEWERELGLDKPVLERYADWIFHALQGDLGDTFISRVDVLGLIGDRLPATIELVVIASVISGGLGVPIGVFSAVRQGGASDYAARTFAILGLAIPSFVLGVVALLIFSRWFGISFAAMEKPDIWEDPIQNLQALMMPGLVLGFALMGGVMRMARSATLEVLHEDYVRTARAKGLGERVIITRHVLRNIMIPILTIFGNQIAFLLGGTVIVEQIFGVRGIGDLFLDAITFRNYPLVMGITLLLGFAVVAMNLLVDLSYAFIDPRIRYS